MAIIAPGLGLFGLLGAWAGICAAGIGVPILCAIGRAEARAARAEQLLGTTGVSVAKAVISDKFYRVSGKKHKHRSYYYYVVYTFEVLRSDGTACRVKKTDRVPKWLYNSIPGEERYGPVRWKGPSGPAPRPPAIIPGPECEKTVRFMDADPANSILQRVAKAYVYTAPSNRGLGCSSIPLCISLLVGFVLPIVLMIVFPSSEYAIMGLVCVTVFCAIIGLVSTCAYRMATRHPRPYICCPLACCDGPGKPDHHLEQRGRADIAEIPKEEISVQVVQAAAPALPIAVATAIPESKMNQPTGTATAAVVPVVSTPTV